MLVLESCEGQYHFNQPWSAFPSLASTIDLESSRLDSVFESSACTSSIYEFAMGSDKRIRFAVIGAGLIGPRHAQTVMENPDTELVAIVDPLESNATLARDLDIAHYQSVTDLLASPAKPDAAIICTPN